MNKTFFLILGILLVLPLVFSQTYQRQTVVDLKIPFEVNGSAASSSATCNVSINYPNGTYLKENASTTNRANGDFNITLVASELNQLGEYEWRAFCCDGGKCAPGYGNFEVTATGKSPVSILQNQILIILIVLATLLLVLGFYLNFASFGFMGSLMFLISGVYTMIYGLSNIVNLYTRVIAITLIGLGFIFMFFSVYDWMFEDFENL